MKSKRILVDTSAWIVGFRRHGPEELQVLLREALERDQVATTPLIVLELLQGCRTQGRIRYLGGEACQRRAAPVARPRLAATVPVGFRLRRHGVTVPTIDLLIAFLAMIHGCVLLHHDRHFRMIAMHAALEAVDFLLSSA